jgi:ammonia channel protein AmtB
MIGLFILWWSWIGFNAGSSYGVTGGKWEFAARAGAGTTLASMSAGMTSMMFSLAKNKGKIDVFEVMSGILSGLGEKKMGKLGSINK